MRFGRAGVPFLLPRSLHPSVLERLECETHAPLLVGALFNVEKLSGCAPDSTTVDEDVSEREQMCLDAEPQTNADCTAPLATFDANSTPSTGSGYGQPKRMSDAPAEPSASSMEVEKREETWNPSIDAEPKASPDRHMASSETCKSSSAEPRQGLSSLS